MVNITLSTNECSSHHLSPLCPDVNQGGHQRTSVVLTLLLFSHRYAGLAHRFCPSNPHDNSSEMLLCLEAWPYHNCFCYSSQDCLLVACHVIGGLSHMFVSGLSCHWWSVTHVCWWPVMPSVVCHTYSFVFVVCMQYSRTTMTLLLFARVNFHRVLLLAPAVIYPFLSSDRCRL